MDQELLIYALAFTGIFTGVLTRTILPYMQKLEENPELKFRKIYVFNAVISACITSVILMKTYDVTMGSPEDVFIMGLLFALAVDEGIIRFMKSYSKQKTNHSHDEIVKIIDDLKIKN